MTNSSSASAYDPFAWVYNKHWGESFLPTILPILDNLVLSQLPKNAKILDLCCGTAQLDEKLTVLGHRVTGLDGSEEMLKFARQNALGVEFIQGDARDFKLRKRFDAAISVFDSLNHIMKLSELTDVFRCVNTALKPGGYFLFDLNTESGYIYDWRGDYSDIENDNACAARSTYDNRKRIAVFDATTFHMENGHWYRKDFILKQKCHDPARVKSALVAAGFDSIEVYGFHRLTGLGELNKQSRRMFFLTRKP